MRLLGQIVFGGLLRGWPGARCPDCRVRPGRRHKAGCATGEWDGGTWA